MFLHELKNHGLQQVFSSQQVISSWGISKEQKYKLKTPANIETDYLTITLSRAKMIWKEHGKNHANENC